MRRTRFITVVLALALGATACGSGDNPDIATAGGPGAAGADSAEMTDAERALAFAACMRENGVDMPDPDPEDAARGPRVRITDPSVDRALVQAAVEACRELAPDGPGQRMADPAVQEQMRQWASCMREHDVDVPDPDPNNPGMLGTVGPDDPAFQAAFEQCQHLFAGMVRRG